MKKLLYLFLPVMFLLPLSQRLQAQTTNLDVQPSPICEGDQASFIFNHTPTKTIAYYKFWFDSTTSPMVQNIGFNPGSSASNTYTFFQAPPGNWIGKALLKYTDSTEVGPLYQSFTVYYRPIGKFSLTNFSKDTQCFRANSYCFNDSSMRNPKQPSNPITSCQWVFGDGGFTDNCGPIVCHSYGISNQGFTVVLKIVDSKGCWTYGHGPNGADSLNVFVIANMAPEFKWDYISGPCFKSCYRFTNLSAISINKVLAYQWDFGDDPKQMCPTYPYWEPDSSIYTASTPFLAKDTLLGIADSMHFDTIIHCYCMDGQFKPMLSIKNDFGCTDSLRKNNSNIPPSISLPKNIRFKFDVTSTKDNAPPRDSVLADSVCAQSGNSSNICYKQTPISFAQVGNGDIVWNFGDPNDPTNRNVDSTTWTPCHAYSGMGEYFPSLTVKNVCPDTTFFYYSAIMAGPYRRFIDEMPDNQRDMMSAPAAFGNVPGNLTVKYRVPPGGFGTDGEALVLNTLDSVKMKFMRTEVYKGVTYYNYSIILNKDSHILYPFNQRYYGDSIYKLTNPTYVYKYADSVPLPSFYVPPPPPPGKKFRTIQDSLMYNAIYRKIDMRDTLGNIKDTIWYVFSRTYNYGVRVMGPFARIENPPVPVVLDPNQKNQCGPTDTVDFVNTSVSYKSRNVWRRWDFGDIYAPQCTSFSVPKHVLVPFNFGGRYDPTLMVEKYPPIVAIDSFAYYTPVPNDTNLTTFHDTLIIMRDTVRMWSNAIQQDRNSDHFFIMNSGVGSATEPPDRYSHIYPGKRNCNFSHDTLPRHLFPNWDSVYLWYRYGHDFMPWTSVITPVPPQRFSTSGAAGTPTVFQVKPWDLKLWGQPTYLNIESGDETLVAGQSWMQHYIDVITVIDPCTGLPKQKEIIRDTLPGMWIDWPRIDTMRRKMPNPTPLDLWPGNARTRGLNTNPAVPDPFQMVLGGYFLINGQTIDTAVNVPQKTYADKGQTLPLPDGITLLPGSGQDFFAYVFRRTIQKCITVTLALADSLNNETGEAGPTGCAPDGTVLDQWDCNGTSTVQLVFGRPDARGMGKKGKECPGLNPTGYPALTFNNANGYPGLVPSCGRTSIWINMDSLADREDYTPCYLDGFTTWGVGTPGTKIAPGPGFNQTPGGLANIFGGRPTFYTGMNWNPFPPSPWTSPSGSVLQYHMGGNSGTPEPADTLFGNVTIGIYIGTGQKDSTIFIWASNYKTNTNNNGTALRDHTGSLYPPPPAPPNPYTYQTIKLIDSVPNYSTPPPVPIPPGWKDDSLAHVYSFFAIKNRTPMVRYSGPPAVWDTMFEIQYLDPNWPRCMSDTVWYHNFWHIQNLDPTFIKSPVEWAVLREKGDTMMVVFADSIQDSLYVNVWTWGDNTATIDSFYYAGFDTTNNYYTHGVRRVRYNMDYTIGWPGVVIDSTVWPCGVYGTRQFMKPERFYKRIFDSIGVIKPDIIFLKDRCPVPIHPASGLYPDTIRICVRDTNNVFFNAIIPTWRKFFNIVGAAAPDTLILQSICPNPTHFDPNWFPYTNYVDTLFIRMKDTAQFTQYHIIDTSLMLLPVTHVYYKTSWEIAGRGPGATNTDMTNFLQNTQQCTYFLGTYATVGVIDTMSIYGTNGLYPEVQDTVFCMQETVQFIDSVRYFRYDNRRTNVPLLIFGTSRGIPYGSMPEMSYQFDTIDFWARDANNPSDTLIASAPYFLYTTYTGGIINLSNTMIDFSYFPGEWRNYNVDLIAGTLIVDTPSLGHWDWVLRGGGVSVVVPNFITDSAYMKPFPGKVIFYPISGALGDPGIYVWGNFGGWYPAFTPVIIDTLRSIYDLSQIPIPTTGRTLIYNNGKGAVKRVGMYYWNGYQWMFICNSPYTSFPFFTHRLYWNFGDTTSLAPQYIGVRPKHQYNQYGRFQVTMVSRDSIGHFDTCIAHVEVMKPVARIHMGSTLIGCKDTASFIDSSFVLTGLNTIPPMDRVDSVKWWFNLRYVYPNGLQGQDTMKYQSILHYPVWFYNQKGVYKIKLAIVTEQGCRDTTTDSLIVDGPRPMFKLISDTIGCKPFRVGLYNFADSLGKRNPSDTPTVCTIFYWGDGQNSNVFGRHDTVWHTYNDTGTYTIMAAGRDVGPFNTPSCPIVYTPDTNGGFQRPLHVIVKQPYRVKIATDYDTVCVGQQFTITNTSDSLNYLKYQYERRVFDSALTFIDSASITGTAPYKNKWDSVGKYKIIMHPIEFQPSVPLTARCASADTTTITAVLPKAKFTQDTTGYPLYKFTNTSTGADHYKWQLYHDSTGTTIWQEVPKSPPDIDWFYDLKDDTGRFKICLIAYKTIPGVTNVESCPDRYCEIINNIYQTKVKIPNVFTPNGDGSNDVFNIEIEGEIHYELVIYNRWGTKVFESGKKDNMWNGKDYNNGSECSNGTYFYIFTYKLRGTPSDKTVHGSVTLLRE